MKNNKEKRRKYKKMHCNIFLQWGYCKAHVINICTLDSLLSYILVWFILHTRIRYKYSFIINIFEYQLNQQISWLIDLPDYMNYEAFLKVMSCTMNFRLLDRSKSFQKSFSNSNIIARSFRLCLNVHFYAVLESGLNYEKRLMLIGEK